MYDRKDWGVIDFHQDHIFSRSLFADEGLKAAGIPQDKWWRYRELCNRFGNLELLLAGENEQKNAKPFSEWVKTREAEFKREHLIPEDEGLLALERFEEDLTLAHFTQPSTASGTCPASSRN